MARRGVWTVGRDTHQGRWEEATSASGGAPLQRQALGDRTPSETEGLDLVGILSSVDETAYVWDLATDRLEWESNAFAILGVDDPSRIATGAAYQALIAPEHVQVRAKAMLARNSADGARGIPYRMHYRLYSGGVAGLDVEDHGRWWPDMEGRPARARGVIRVLTESYLREQRSIFRSEVDELTGQLNRARLTDAISAVLARSVQKRQPCGLLMIAVKNLAVINDTFGHAVGDEVLASVARRLKSKLRSGDVIGRYSSNKFGVVVRGCDPAALRILAEDFIKVVRDGIIRTETCQLSATVSIGGVVMPTQVASVPEALNMALRALEKAKSRQFDCYVPYEASTGAELERTRNKAIADSVITAIDDRRMRLVLQPLIGATSARPEIYEGLLRMERKDGALVSAGEFIPIAEQLGLARLVDRRTLELAIDLLKQHEWLKLSINVSGLTCSDREWLVALQRLTEGRADILHRLIVEITETAAIQDLDQSISFVDTLKELGCRVAIDDFGAGYTSFKHLKMLNVDMVKIDGAFVRNLTSDTTDQIFVKTMIELAQKFNLETVAEWVGDARSVDHLVAAGITYLQGYYFGMPIDAADIGEAA